MGSFSSHSIYAAGCGQPAFWDHVQSLNEVSAMQMTYPLDTMRLRMAVDPSALTLRGTARMLLREGSYSAFFRGLGASLFGGP